jgi:hypothetical protein
MGQSIVDSASHGWLSGNGTVHYEGNGTNLIFSTAFSFEDAENLDNGYKLPLVYSSSCSSGNFTEVDDTNLERLLTAPNGGAIGFVGATVKTFRCEYEEYGSFGNWWLNRKFWELFFNGSYQPGETLYKTKLAYWSHVHSDTNPHKTAFDFTLYKTDFLAYNLLGDPEASIWTDIPHRFNVSSPSELKQYPQTLRITVYDSTTNLPVSNAMVCITDSHHIYVRASTDSSGTAEFNIAPVSYDTLKLTVTAHNFLPFEQELEVIPAINLAVRADELQIYPEYPGASMEVHISATVYNLGVALASSVVVEFYDGKWDEGGTLIGHSLLIPELHPNEYISVGVDWIMSNGSCTIWVVVDPANTISEFDETDNMACKIISPNSPPVITGLPDRILNEDSVMLNAIKLSHYAWDVDGPMELSFNIFEVSNPNCQVSINENGYIDIHPCTNWYGNVEVTIEVSDGSLSDYDKFTIVVLPVNDPPRFINLTSKKLELRAIEDVKFYYKLHAEDVDNELLYFSDNTDLFEIDNHTGELIFVPDNGAVGTHRINLTVSDGELENWVELILTVENTNDVPRIEPIGSVTAYV